MNTPVATFETLPASTKLWFLSIAFADLNDSEAAARSALLLEHSLHSLLGISLIEVAVVRYSKPYKGNNLPNDRRRRVYLPDRFRPHDDYSQRLHAVLIEARDKTMAHSDMDAREAKIQRMPDNQAGLSIWEAQVSSLTLGPETMTGLAELCKATRQLMLPEIRELAGTVLPDAAVGQMFDLQPDTVHLIDTAH